ncbi:hypothetical protein [Flammeovirga kamogawensis]|uniref:PKD domain-containing protein n=1 Tax=Flammeovirga kamogawensis TaxID=373891 RepID=A0ABX8GQR6_9BACT|nr:hypothetical protein [Flammeovirga kamogawensis]MBB6462023.1 hypothetical protein [Flammeovirga kamogawensis]QWG05759.1 hypothetical protein KM029_10230 [Flammeovirga kamogawensis]TRX67585.1 hypothetical protein EO216_05250 [Flammeovirga kamogawensis]
MQKVAFGVLCFFFTSISINFIDETTTVKASNSIVTIRSSPEINGGTVIFKWDILDNEKYLNPVEVVFDGEKYSYRGAGTETIKNLSNGTYKVEITLLDQENEMNCNSYTKEIKIHEGEIININLSL